MTKLKEAQKREDMLLDLYKFHAYIPNDAMGNPLTPFGNFCEGYEAARAIDAKRIAELEAQNKAMREELNICKELLVECVDDVRNEYNEMVSIYHTYPHKSYDIECQKNLLDGIERAIALDKKG